MHAEAIAACEGARRRSQANEPNAGVLACMLRRLQPVEEHSDDHRQMSRDQVPAKSRLRPAMVPSP